MKGKEKCDLLKGIRRQVADEYDLDYPEHECHHEDDCLGTCPQCEAELRALQAQLDAKGIEDVELEEETVIVPQEGMMDLTDHRRAAYMLQGFGPDPDPDDELMLAGIPAPTSHYRKRVVYKECPVAGWKYHQKYFPFTPEEGAELLLIRDRKNEHDSYAVAVALADYYDEEEDEVIQEDLLGYVPRTDNRMIAQLMDMGWDEVFTAELTTVAEKGRDDERMRMTIYIQSKDEKADSGTTENKVYAMLLDDEGLKELQRNLAERGSMQYRWGGFPPWEKDLPEEGDKVLVVYKNDEEATLYLMRMMAKDVQAVPFLEHPEDELYMVDDCCPYVLTNIAGPKKVPLEDIEYLDVEQNCRNQPNGRLADWAAEHVMQLFEAEI